MVKPGTLGGPVTGTLHTVVAPRTGSVPVIRASQLMTAAQSTSL